MKFGYITISILMVFSLYSVAHAKDYSCAGGRYTLTTSCWDCPAGCYCTGKDGRLDPEDKIQSTEVAAYCESGTKCSHSGSDGYGDCGKPWNSGLYRCPADFPNSDGKADSEQSCYKMYNGQKFYHIARGCKAGTYIPAGTQSKDVNVAPCLNCKDGYYCPGFSFKYVSPTQDVGLEKCSSNQVPNAARTACQDCPAGTQPNAAGTACVDPNTKGCIAGTYLPANSTSCAACPDGYVCKGGSFLTQPIAQGNTRCTTGVPNENKTACVSCPAGQEANADHTKCNIIVQVGYYLPANRKQQVACAGEGKYCPGGTYETQSVDQGRFDCPYKSKPLPDKSGCNLTLTKDQVQYGPLGKQASLQCWTLSDPDDYKNCIFGIKSKD